MIPIEYNEDLRERLAELSRPKVEQYTVRAGSYDLHVKEYRPPNFDVSKKYAVLFSVYGGPGSQKVTDTYGYGFESGYLVSNFDLVVVNLDARGTCCRGERFKHAVYKQIGKAEAEDTIAVAKYVASKPYVDENKIAIWGWSYGGFLTSYVLGQNSNVFKVGMAVAPVTDWRYYDSIYTERYMLTPQENHEGYEISSVLPLANNFKNESFLVVHGTGDEYCTTGGSSY
ncbi:probable dipeptidyl-aminopeptidase B isoform X7 [Acropora millepora]|uniref:probable dipeptidyl-aminopeptidase B isoform X7 n=1 Tax=Acropora millepora TaxID=45264 RepID=UPI001CF28A16|nr:probable dipeptidyl-aminopeptidase B isoform X7 [Acropora millepora]XP_044171109.1 probable dipeptidyl-aminopeptidase B isoform X7 [Acropora millepora]XP_044171110.1 probable dipeptidyl-aminopeptidase B isoform X7 [Acropora millepora]